MKKVLCIVLSLMLAAPAFAQNIVLSEKVDERIEIDKPALFPEDIKYDAASGHFFVGSFREGAVYAVDMQGKASRLVEDDHLVSALGIEIDAGRNRLYVATANLGAGVKAPANVKKLAGLGIYALDTGAPLAFVDLGALLPEGMHLANGITKDAGGNIYVTDSLSPVIYKVDGKDYSASIFLQDEAFKGNGINLNGMAYHPGGFFLVVKKSDGRLFKVPAADPKRFTEVKLPQALVGADGLTLADGNDAVVVANKVPGTETNAAFALYSDDDWQSARITGRYDFGDVYPTNATVKDGKIYAVSTGLGELIAAEAEKKATLTPKAVIRMIGVVQSK